MLAELTAERHRRLLSLVERPGGELSFLRQVVELWREVLGLDAAAAYLLVDGHLERELEVGEGTFPEVVEDSLPRGLRIRRFAQGALVTSDAVDLEGVAEPLPLLLATALCLCALRSQLKRQDFEAKYRGVELQALYDVGLAITATLDLDVLSEEILIRAVSLLDARRGALYLLEGDRYRLRFTIGGAATGELQGDSEMVRRAVEEREDVEARQLLPGARHLLVVPIEVERQRRGLLAMGDKERRSGVGSFGEGDSRTLALFANQAALALENARLHQEALEKERLEREMELASQIQREILPRGVPTVSGFDVLGWSRPARHVGGDYYDFVALTDGAVAAVVGDVTGKGVPAALLVSTLHSALRLLLEGRPFEPALFVSLNDHLLEFSSANKFATLFVVRLDPNRHHLTYFNAGHNPGLLVRVDGSVERLRAGGVPMGLLQDMTFESGEVEPEPGDLLCLYSDGVTEAVNRSGEEFGMERLERLLSEGRREPLNELRRAVVRAVDDFSRGLPQADDETLLLVRRSAG